MAQLYAYYDSLFLYLIESGPIVTTIAYSKGSSVEVPTKNVLATGTLNELIKFRENMLRTNVIIIKNTRSMVTLSKVNPKKSWNNCDCSDRALLKIIKRPEAKIERIQFVDDKGIADILEIYIK